MWTKYLWLILVGLNFHFHIVFSDEDCQVVQKPKLQIVFVCDFVLTRQQDTWIKFQNLTVFHLIDFIKQNFEAEFAVTGFIDYPDTATPKAITDPEACYFLMETLTTDKNKTLLAISKNIFTSGNNEWDNHVNDTSDSLTTAMLFSAVDKRLKWNSGFYDEQGNLIRKIMIPMVWRDYTRVLQTPGNRKPPKADGTDKCANALIPEIEQLDQVLFDNQFTVVNSIINGLVLEEIPDQVYGKLFAGLFIPYYQAPIPNEGEYVTDFSKFDYKGYAKRIYDIILQEVMSCDWEDPVGYNSLGF